MAVEGCGSNLIKYTMFGVNSILAVLALVSIGFGAWALLDKNAQNILDWNFNITDTTGKTEDLPASSFNIAIYVIIAIAVFIFVVSFFGCCGAVSENRLALGIYFVIIFLIFAVQLGMAILTFVVVSSDDTRGEVHKLLQQNTTDTQLKQIQETFVCCGDGYDSGARFGVACTKAELAADIGCAQAMYNVIKAAGVIVGAIGMTIAGVLMMAMCFACCLMFSIQ